MADEQRALALGVQSVFFRAFGSIPGPILFGVIFDSVCVYWQYECGRRGNCWVYDNHNLSLRAFAIAFAGMAANVALSFLSWIFYPTGGTKEVSSSSSGVEEKSLGSDKEIDKNPLNELSSNVLEVSQNGVQISSADNMHFAVTQHGTSL